ncbi:hypothetical protein ACVMIH_002336 [Bradyrhizobium sp. USDA 4503]
MLRVTIEILPGGAEELRRTVGLMTIGNISNFADVSDYSVRATEGANPLAGTPSQTRNFIVRRHARHQSVWKLLARILAEMDSVGSTGL